MGPWRKGRFQDRERKVRDEHGPSYYGAKKQEILKKNDRDISK